ncbi:MAG: hypothetical protein ABFD60_15200 [Bryobacteraceae bacterium]
MPYAPMVHDGDPRKPILERIGDVSNVEMFGNNLLVAVYIRPQKTQSGIYLPDQTTDEDRFQSKVGLIIGKGPFACRSEDVEWFGDKPFNLNDWIVYRPSDGWSITINGVLCRMLLDSQVRMRISHPDAVY